ncbi:MAG: response regulator [Syntrophobacteraceae bacterium]|nr:response regulator [Syntrophobacteraceae bacterium]
MKGYPTYKVLVIDDDKQLVESIAQYLLEQNLDVCKEYGAERAIKKISQYQPDIVISDISMADIDGWDLFKRTAAMRTKMIFIFMTEHGNIPDSADSIRKGVFDYLEKPFSSHKLQCVVNSAIDFLDTLAENKYLNGRLNQLQSQSSQVDLLLKKADMLTDFMSSLKNETSTEEVLKKLLRASLETTGSIKGSIFQYRSREASLELVMIDWLENSNGLSSYGCFEAVDKPSGQTEGAFSPELPQKPRSAQGRCGKPEKFSLTIPVEDAHTTWGILYLHGKIGGGQYSSEDFINVSSLTRKAVEILNQIEYMGQHSIFSTDREKLQKEHRRLQIHKTSLKRSSSVASVLVDGNLSVLHVCDKYKDTFGSGENMATGSFKKHRIWQGIGTITRERITNSLSSNEVISVDDAVSLDTHSGMRLFKIKFIPVPLYKGNFSIGMYMIIIEDITDQEKITKRLALLENLAIMGKFVANIAHDLNNPLDGINRLIRILEINISNVAYIEHDIFEMIYSAIRRMGNTVRSFLECTRDAMLKTTSSPLLNLIDDALYIMAPTLEDKNISIVKKYNTKNARMEIPTSFYHVFINIIKNGYDAMDEGGELQVRVSDGADKKTVMAIFSDSGQGIPAAIMGDVTRPFFTTKEDGTGLGLALCEKISKGFGGDIVFKNRKGGGCEVSVIIPLAQAGRVAAPRGVLAGGGGKAVAHIS